MASGPLTSVGFGAQHLKKTSNRDLKVSFSRLNKTYSSASFVMTGVLRFLQRVVNTSEVDFTENQDFSFS
jgi:hypothetical protein